MSFELVFAVPMECESCVNSVSKTLTSVENVSSYDINLKNNIVTTKGTAPPSEIVKAIQSTGRDAIIRGTGQPNSAAVCILESFDPKDYTQPVKGLARIVGVSPNSLFIDLTVNGLPKGTYFPSIRASGNLSQGALSTGDLFYQLDPIEISQASSNDTVINSLGASQVVSEGLCSGQSYLKADLSINDLIGRSVILSRLDGIVTPDSLCGVIARSAGAWENDKQVCSCTGKTVWQERTEAVSKGLKT
ncbi:superoxide dismutase 1 copper chaperone [[Candida] railenensis]|uniref:Superoxide dismutase 1 copper chaperone n=1 Tax=[Candida] railenensis TaxID=45579 RepID=A0A9P0QN78_9ASCO|nr:superoxide dismutase 1 copper chaperone [[Candida] railenensis]